MKTNYKNFNKAVDIFNEMYDKDYHINLFYDEKFINLYFYDLNSNKYNRIMINPDNKYLYKEYFCLLEELKFKLFEEVIK